MSTPIIHVTTSSGSWDALAAIGTFVSAAATVGLAVFTARMAAKTNEMAQRTNEEAAATAEAAKASLASALATEELARQGQLAYQPVLDIVLSSMEHGGLRGNPNRIQASLEITNIGRGPAIGVVLAARESERWALSAPTSLRPDRGQLFTAADRGEDVPAQWWTPKDEPNETVTRAIFCRDVLNNRYRFLVRGAHVPPPDVVPAVDPARPMGDYWWSDPRLWGTPF